MRQLREFLNQQIEVFLNHEFGPMQNMTPEGIRRILWEPEHTARLVGHLAGNWEMVEGALRLRQEEAVNNAQTAAVVAESFAEQAISNAQADAAAAEWDATPEGEKPPVNPEVPW